MLSFMREQELENSSGQEDLKDTASTPVGGSGEPGSATPAENRQQEYLTAAKNKNVRKTTYMLAVLFGIGLLCLLFMIRKSAPQAAKADVSADAESRIETAIARITGIKSEMFVRMDEIVKKFYEFSNVQQIKVDELAKNPFKYEMAWADLNPVSSAEEGQSGADAYMIRQRQLRQRAKDLQLLTIMESERGKCCMIDDKILYEGDSIKGFKVRQISNGFVRLEWDADPSENVQLILKLSQ
jgi:preprotein translocase subunit SecG